MMGMTPWDAPKAIFMGTMLIFWAMPMAATASAPKLEVKLLSTVIPVTFSRFWIAAGMPTAHTPETMTLSSRNMLGRMHT